MRFPKLTPLQSRFAASLGASVSLIVLYLLLSGPQLAYAVDIDSTKKAPQDAVNTDASSVGNYGIVSGELMGRGLDGIFGDGIVIRDVPAGVGVLDNNKVEAPNIDPGETQHYVFLKEALAGPKSPGPTLNPEARVESQEDDISQDIERRADSANSTTPLYISLNTCLVPSSNSSDTPSDGPAPQMKVYISQSESTQKPGPDVDDPNQIVIEADGGYVGTTVNATGDIFIGVSAPKMDSVSGVYNYEIAASTDAPYHAYNEATPDLYFVDGDSYAALLVTNDTTQANPGDDEFTKWMEGPPPFTMFAQNINDTSISGLEKSYCGLNKFAKISKITENVEAGMTSRGLGGKPKEQFYITSLNESSTYYGFLAIESNDTTKDSIGGGGKVWKAMNFSTKAGMHELFPLRLFFDTNVRADYNCAVIFNLEFCSEVAYAVPSNRALKVQELMDIYDTNAAALYKNFSRSLQQIACNTSSTSRYSLARDCDHCASAYKQWLCAVTVPRCTDFSSDLPFLRARNIGQPFSNGSTLDESSPYFGDPWANSSRNPLIDTEIKPGPYKEVLPCQDLCYDLVQSCPAALGFGCPDGSWFNASYGTRSPDGDITCSYLGAAYFLNAGWRVLDGTRLALWALTVFWAANLAFAL
jgi:calcium channel MID1